MGAGRSPAGSAEPTALLGWYLAAAALLIVAGAAKAARPADTARAVSALVVWLPAGRAVAVVRVLAAVEAIVGLFAALRPGVSGGCLVAVSYVGFAGFVLVARANGGALSTCGCFAAADTPPTLTHVAVDLFLAVGAAAVAVSGSGGWLPARLDHQSLGGVPLIVSSTALAVVAFGLLSSVPRLEHRLAAKG